MPPGFWGKRGRKRGGCLHRIPLPLLSGQLAPYRYGAGEIRQLEYMIGGGQVRKQAFVIGLVTAHAQPQGRIRETPVLAAGVGPAEIRCPWVCNTTEHRPIPPGILHFGKAAPAPRGRHFRQSETLGKLHLLRAAAAGNGQQAGTVHLAGAFRFRRRHMQGAQGTQQNIPHPGVTQYDMQCVPALGHGTLPQHLAGNYEGCAVTLQKTGCFPQHAYLAVNARVHCLAEAVGRPREQRGNKGLADINRINIKAVCLPPMGNSIPAAEKRGYEMQALHGKSLLLNKAGRENAVQAPGK